MAWASHEKAQGTKQGAGDQTGAGKPLLHITDFFQRQAEDTGPKDHVYLVVLNYILPQSTPGHWDCGMAHIALHTLHHASSNAFWLLLHCGGNVLRTFHFCCSAIKSVC